ncbi:hypothetical protein J6590_063494 [Homalodisca vitripennis]|nr:hypothetical protein J6590_063494 [Homalodisca vitripennis]
MDFQNLFILASCNSVRRTSHLVPGCSGFSGIKTSDKLLRNGSEASHVLDTIEAQDYSMQQLNNHNGRLVCQLELTQPFPHRGRKLGKYGPLISSTCLKSYTLCLLSLDSCNLNIPASEIIAKCVECSAIFHPGCTRFGTGQAITKSKMKSWKCDNCKSDSASVKSNEDSINLESIMDATSSLKNEINANTNRQLNEVASSFKNTFTFTEELGKINNKLDDLEKSHKDICVRCDGQDRNRDGMREDLWNLQQKMNDSEPHARCANLEILGIPLTPGEHIYMCLEHIAKVISVPFSKKVISVARRLRLYSRKHAHPPISWLAAARHKKGINTTEISPSLTPGNVYINEQLTPHNKALLGRARRLVRAKKIHFAGFFNWKIIIKPTENTDSIRVLHMEDFGPKAFDSVKREKLINKLEAVGVRGGPLAWFSSYLSNRFQFLSVCGVASDPLQLSDVLSASEIKLAYYAYIQSMLSFGNIAWGGGKAYAMVILKTALVHILRRLRVKSHTKLSDIEYELRTIMFSKTPLLVTFHPR